MRFDVKCFGLSLAIPITLLETMTKSKRLRSSEDTLSAFAFGATMFSSACLNNLFVTYYLELFLYVQKVDPWWFYIGQILFMVWNSINDPLFGWLSDIFSPFSYRSNRRLGAIRYGGWLWVAAFLYIWWIPGSLASPTASGLHFVISLCFYDCMLTFVEVNHSALLAELSTSSEVRANANMYAAICAGLGSLSAFFSRMFWSRDDLYAFQKYCVVIGLLALVGFEITAAYLHVPKLSRGKYTEARVSSQEHEVHSAATRSSSLSFFQFLRQLFQSHNFVCFSVVSLFQVFDCAFGKNFFSIFLADFSGNALSPNAQGFVVSLSFVLPWVCTVFLTPIVKKVGAYNVIQGIFKVRICIVFVGLFYALSTSKTSWLYLMVNRIASECVCRLMPLIKSNLVDEDAYLNSRERAMSASVIGSSEFISKAGQSLAPMLGYFILRRSANLVAPGDGNAEYQTFWPSVSIALLPLFVVLIQLFVWGKFQLRGQQLKIIRENARKNDSLSSV